MSSYFKDKVVVVTGGTDGIGKALVDALLASGAKVATCGRNSDKLYSLQTEYPSAPLHTMVADVSSENDCRRFIEVTIKVFGGIDVLINNAGISMRANFEELDLSVIKEIMDTNFYGTVYCTKFALPYLIKQKGTVIGISSVTGLTPLPGRTGYAASKYAMDGFLNTLRLETLKKGLHVLIVHPGFTTSNIRKLALNKNGNPQKESPRDEARMMSAEKVAQIIARAALKRGKDITLTLEGKIAVWMYKNFPGITDRIILHEMAKESGAKF